MYAPLEFIQQQEELINEKEFVKAASEFGVDTSKNLEKLKFSLIFCMQQFGKLKFNNYNEYYEQTIVPFYEHIKDMNDDEIISFLYSGIYKVMFGLGNMDRNSKAFSDKILDDYEMYAASVLITAVNNVLKESGLSNSFLNLADMLDQTVFGFVINKFAQNKQVYQLNSTFSKHLRKTNMEDFELTSYELSHLPCNTFWIDCSECEGFGNTAGVLVDVREANNEKIVSLYNINKINTDKKSGYIYYSRYINFSNMKEIMKNIVKLSNEEQNNLISANNFDKITSAEFGNEQEIKNQLKNNAVNTNILIVLQLLKYMSMEDQNKDIAPSEKTKSTYRPSVNKVVKNKFSEVQIHDVGYVFGSTFDKYERKVKEEIKRREKNTEVDSVTKLRKSPIPHYVSAHFHRFWCKDENKQNYLKTMWIEPYWTGVDKEDKSKLVVIHKLTNSSISEEEEEISR